VSIVFSLKKVLGIGTGILALAFGGMTIGLFSKGQKDKADDKTLQVVSIASTPYVAEGAVDLVLNPGVPADTTLVVKNLLKTDNCFVTLSYVFPEERPTLAQYLSVAIKANDASVYEDKILASEGTDVVSSYQLKEDQSVTFAFEYSLAQDYPVSGESFDFKLHLDSHASTFGH
jgi:hypothetical protein